MPIVINQQGRPLEELEANENSIRYKSIKSVSSKYHLKPQIFDLEEFKASDFYNFDPVIILENTNEQRIEYLCGQLEGIRTIFIGSDNINPNRNYSIVAVDQYESISKILNYLLSAGRGKIALFAFAVGSIYSANYVDVLLETAGKFDLDLKRGDVFWTVSSLQDCWEQFKHNIRNYNAIICPNDASAIYLCKEAAKLSFSIPDDLFIIGNGDMTVGRMSKPAITTISANEEEIGRQVILLYKYMKKHKGIKKATILVGCDLIVRDSTGFHQGKCKAINNASFARGKNLYNSEAYDQINALEKMLNSCDEVDLRIIDGIKKGVTYEVLAQNLFISRDTVLYKIKRILEMAKVNSKNQLFERLGDWNITL